MTWTCAHCTRFLHRLKRSDICAVCPPARAVLETTWFPQPKGLYKGMAAPLAGVAPMYALCFLGYGVGKNIFCDDDAFDKLKLTQIGLAGATSSLFTTPILGPGERLKCVLQIQESPSYKGPKYNGYKELVNGLYKEGGVMGVCRGSGITCVRDGVASFFYFSTYEFLKKSWTPPGEKSPGVFATFCAGGFAGIANWSAMMPLDTVKSRYQVAPAGQYSGVAAVAKDIMAKEGIKGFYKGLAPVLVRAFPANAACFLGYEAAGKVLTSMGLE